MERSGKAEEPAAASQTQPGGSIYPNPTDPTGPNGVAPLPAKEQSESEGVSKSFVWMIVIFVFVLFGTGLYLFLTTSIFGDKYSKKHNTPVQKADAESQQ